MRVSYLVNVYRYNGKELDEATGLYDYGARYYDPAIARWTGVDPLADEFAPWSPYSYVYDNPLIHTDPTGMAADWYPEYDKETQQINLVAEEGDNLASLEQWANGAFSNEELSALYSSMNEGKIDLSSTFVGKFVQGFLADADSGEQCQFNCFSSAISGARGESKTSGYGDFVSQPDFQNFLFQDGYTIETLDGSISTNAQPFKSILGYAAPGNNERLEHVAFFAGKDQSGNSWVLTKNGYRNENNGKLGLEGNRYEFQKGANFNTTDQKVISPSFLYNKQ